MGRCLRSRLFIFGGFPKNWFLTACGSFTHSPQEKVCRLPSLRAQTLFRHCGRFVFSSLQAIANGLIRIVARERACFVAFASRNDTPRIPYQETFATASLFFLSVNISGKTIQKGKKNRSARSDDYRIFSKTSLSNSISSIKSRG